MQALKNPTLTEQVYQVLRLSILGNELGGGEPLRIEDVARQLHVSTTPVREAFNRLASDGLIDLQPNRTARVSGIAEKEVSEIYDVRLLLEPCAAKSTIDSLRAERNGQQRGHWESMRERVEALLAQLGSSEPERTDYEEYLEVDWLLQELLAEGAGSGLLRKLISLANNHVFRLRLFAESSSEFERCVRMRKVLSEHLAIVEAVLHGQSAEATSAIAEHLMRGKERTLLGFKGVADTNTEAIDRSRLAARDRPVA